MGLCYELGGYSGGRQTSSHRRGECCESWEDFPTHPPCSRYLKSQVQQRSDEYFTRIQVDITSLFLHKVIFLSSSGSLTNLLWYFTFHLTGQKLLAVRLAEESAQVQRFFVLFSFLLNTLAVPRWGRNTFIRWGASSDHIFILFAIVINDSAGCSISPTTDV